MTQKLMHNRKCKSEEENVVKVVLVDSMTHIIINV